MEQLEVSLMRPASAGYALMLRVIADMRRVPELGEATSSESPSESTSPASPTTAASSSSLSSSSSLPRRQRSGHQRLGILRKGPLEAAGGRAALAQHLLVWHAARTSPVSTAALSSDDGGPSLCQCFSTRSCLIDSRLGRTTDSTSNCGRRRQRRRAGHTVW